MSWAANATLAAGIAFIALPSHAAAMMLDQPSQSGNTANAPASKAHWIIDAQTNCRVLNSSYDPDESVKWTGDCGDGTAGGIGTLTFSNRGQAIQTLTGTFRGGALQDGHVKAGWADGSSYDGTQAAGRFDGPGVFVSSVGDHIDGQWKNGRLDGHAAVAWANGDRYDGDWRDGLPEGHGLQIWANGARYDGEWHAGHPTRRTAETPHRSEAPGGESGADAPAGATQSLSSGGTPNQTAFGLPSNNQPAASLPVATPGNAVDASLSPLPAHATLPVSAPAVANSNSGTTADAGGPHWPPLTGLAGKPLMSVDGSKITLAASDDGITRQITQADGAARETAFAFINERQGTVADAPDLTRIIGMFHLSDGELDVDYADGHTEVLKPNDGGGLTIARRTPDGGLSCVSWFPEGHIFTAGDRKAALRDYASHIGATSMAPSAGPASRTAGCATAQKNGAGPRPASNPKNSIKRAQRSSQAGKRPARLELDIVGQTDSAAAATLRSAVTGSPQTVLVRQSTVHLVDAPRADEPGEPSTQGGSVDLLSLAKADARDTPQLEAPPALAASGCLNVESDGAHWGFHNHCGFPVQFSYCEMSQTNPLTSCGAGSISGSVAPNGFSMLVADESFKEKSADHDFRWIGCGGGAGEVVPHLDHADPPGGRCMHARLSQK